LKGSEHYNWLSKTIDDARESGIKWIILGMHKNCITIGVKTCEVGEDLLSLAVSKKVDVILQGHEHNYIRSKQLALSSDCPRMVSTSFNKSCIVNQGKIFEKNAGTIVVISGAGGTELRDINLNDAEIGYFDTWNGSNSGNSHGFSKFTLKDGKLDAEFVAVNGTYKDSFTITSE